MILYESGLKEEAFESEEETAENMLDPQESNHLGDQIEPKHNATPKSAISSMNTSMPGGFFGG